MSHFHKHWVLAIATKDVPNVQEFDRWSQNWNTNPILFTLLQPYTYINTKKLQVDMPGRVMCVQVFLSNQESFPLFDPRQIRCVYQRVDPTSTHHFLRFTNKQDQHWVDPHYKLFESKNNYQQSLQRESYFTPVPYLNVQQGLMVREMNQLPSVINYHTPTHLSELHNVHLTAIYKSF